MATVIQLSQYRRKPAAPAPINSADAVYFCTRCDGETFRLAETGLIHCAECSSLMRDLAVRRDR